MSNSFNEEFFKTNKILSSLGFEHPKELCSDERYMELLEKPLLTGNDLLELPYQSNDYLIENLLWRNDIAIIIAQEKAGKTIFSSQMAYSLTCGKPFLGSFDVCEPMKVLYIQTEGTLYQTQQNIKSAVESGQVSWNPDNWRHMFCPALALDKDEGLEYVIDRIDKANYIPQVIFIDPLYMAMSGSLIDDKPARAFCGNIRRLQERYNCSFLIMHHEHRPRMDNFGGKIHEGDNAIHGSFVWKAFPSHVLRIEWNKKNNERMLSCSTARNGNVVKQIKMNLIENPLMFEVIGGNAPQGSIDVCLELVRQMGSACVKDIADKTGMPEGTVRNAFTRLKQSNLIKIKTKSKNTYYEPTHK